MVKTETEFAGKRLGIDVKSFVRHFEVHPDIWETLRKYPTLCYLLGDTVKALDSNGEQIHHGEPGKVDRPIWFLTEGSGMFGLTHKEDADRWKGIFNHIIGSTRFVEAMAVRFTSLNEEQKKQFEERGYDMQSLKKVDPVKLRDFMFVTHAARRIVDENTWHTIDDNAHPFGDYGDVRDSGQLTEKLLRGYNAPDEFIELIQVEQRAEHLIDLGKSGRFTDFRFAIMTYCDWIFNQKPVTLEQRFEGLQKSGRETNEALNQLQEAGRQFEDDIRDILGITWNDVTQSPMPEWEYEIRNAYCAPSGLSMQGAFPAFCETLQEQRGDFSF